MYQYNSILNTKLPRVGTTIFTIMSRMAAEYDAINLSQGFPDYSSPPELIDLVYKHMKAGHNQYAPMEGLIGLRESIAAKMEDSYSAQYDPEEEITITAGATQAIYSAISAVVHEGDEVIIFEPAYDCYAPAITLNGGIPIYVELEAPDYAPKWDQIKRILNHRTRLIIINTPHNPTGSALTAQDMLQLQKLTKNTDIMILSDEVYEHIMFDGKEHQSVARYPELAERSFVIYSMGKTFHNTGWKMGYCLAPQKLMKEFRKAHQYIVFAVNTPMQYAFAEYIKNKEHYQGLGEMYQQKRDHFQKLLRESNFTILPCTGTYFQLLGYDKIYDQKDTEVAELITKEHKVASVPLSPFFSRASNQKLLRFCFAKSDDQLEQAAERLCKI